MKCKICGKEFTPSKESRVLCSDECRKESQRVALRRQQEKRRAKARELLGTRFCEVCGKEFVPRTRMMVRCSPACTAQLGNIYKQGSRKAKRERITEGKKRRKNKHDQIAEFTVNAWKEGRSYGKQEMQGYLAKQSEEMAQRRKELDAEWERKRRMKRDGSAVAESVER